MHINALDSVNVSACKCTHYTVRCMSVDVHRCWADRYVFRGHCIDKSSSDDRQSDEYARACRLIFMHINALISICVHQWYLLEIL